MSTSLERNRRNIFYLLQNDEVLNFRSTPNLLVFAHKQRERERERERESLQFVADQIVIGVAYITGIFSPSPARNEDQRGLDRSESRGRQSDSSPPLLPDRR